MQVIVAMIKRVEQLLIGMLLAAAVLLPGVAGAEETDDRFAFPPEVVEAEEAEARGETTAAAPAAEPEAAKPAKPAADKPVRQPSAADAAVAPDVKTPPLPRIDTPRRLADYALRPEELASASRYETPSQRMIASLLEEGESNVDDLVRMITTERGDALDHIVINIASQRLYEMNVNGQVIREEKISSGAKGYDTPLATYNIVNKAPKAYSKKYTAWMLQWMGLTSDGAYGMHGLEGSSYERHLGKVASHGCIRLSRAYAKELYPRVKVGMPVTILNDKNLELKQYVPLTEAQARALVLETISPADPGALFY